MISYDKQKELKFTEKL